jgi:hypothetical protein
VLTGESGFSVKMRTIKKPRFQPHVGGTLGSGFVTSGR